MASADLGKELECSICLDVYRDAVTLSCGHNFCQLCIDQHLKRQDVSGVYSCPECRAEFQERPTQQRNITLCNVVENFLSAHQYDALYFCSYCMDAPVPAVKSCLHCEASLCDRHLRVHSKAAEHVLTEPSSCLQNKKCSIHKKILEYYCTNDALSACVCVSCCMIGEHQGHKMESLHEASEKKKVKLRNVLQTLNTKREETEVRVKNLEKHKKQHHDKAAGEAESVTALCRDIRRWLDDLEKTVLGRISRQEERESLSISELIKKLEIKKDEMSGNMRHIEELCNMTDPLTVLQDPDTGDLCDTDEEEGGKKTVGCDRFYQGEKLISHITHKLSDILRDVNVTFYVQDPVDIILDVNTADNNLQISDDLKMATWTQIKQSRPETNCRFQNFQVLSSTRIFSGRLYWDVEISDSEEWSVGMCYPRIDRRGCQSYIGDNKKSWCLHGEQNSIQYSVIHDNKVIVLPSFIFRKKFRMCLDYEAGQLSFYELRDPIRHLHTFSATFTEPLHAALYIWKGNIKILEGGPILTHRVF
ncbi:LOW QUALITY PROTEIN: E3 ubiquitin/ISG15 ligase TRIM25-like [Anomaloglossus baeobatrachus]|uniref:LOW QUALITY PROTEIN: E3 ubiquitin/ISG15 ligase TRIM25-like n=1 Tax=Anomaloglossus baeobatrachus TaxID=238106 RepID=UPI003F500EB0